MVAFRYFLSTYQFSSVGGADTFRLVDYSCIVTVQGIFVLFCYYGTRFDSPFDHMLFVEMAERQ